MRFSVVLVASLALVVVSACEQTCMDGVTHAWLSNYTTPVTDVLTAVANQISANILRPESRPSEPLALLQPIINAYDDQSFSALETAIFPSFFHGKCQQDGVDPPGCPNPDCPVVCGTPGSLVHFYGKLRYIAYNQTRHMLENLSKPGSTTYKQVEKMVLQHASKSRRVPGSAQRYMRRDILSTFDTSSVGELTSLTTRSTDAETTLKSIMSQVGSMLEKACGGSGDGNSNGLPDCSWEGEMKAFILSYP
ncbi:hypothetical protein GLOTRDRAFT_132419 [Gloeophyllum trabeum ATCC 11539]|uniref:Uncharacterized protein n=1 Tax=Gloeophyllum trabeum (strain ATCC 11539 / FP-39264 / Madison 617) TaxID=670483 RepID=S7PXR2_GLOTA|nr:uncharacterized protein GLOTRDRAFT_132419 [Gloeophyllum trabeum ATCC 11539]EPQ52303.1 hypothetical protein GLOTRDRAFT_132419 [Gloeophyllum trabeum ATCC 11539]